jgi:hypothetical protein
MILSGKMEGLSGKGVPVKLKSNESEFIIHEMPEWKHKVLRYVAILLGMPENVYCITFKPGIKESSLPTVSRKTHK